MSAEYMHIGIPVLTKKEGMTYNEWGKFWCSNPDDYDYKIEYLKFEEGTRFPDILARCWHVAYKVDNMDPYLDDADSIICAPIVLNEKARLAFIEKDGAIIELYEEK